MKSRIARSSGNVFADLGFPPEEVAVLTLRAELMVVVVRSSRAFFRDGATPD
jgi:hypothetical protein